MSLKGRRFENIHYTFLNAQCLVHTYIFIESFPKTKSPHAMNFHFFNRYRSNEMILFEI